MSKPYKAKSLSGAQRRARLLEKQREFLESHATRLSRETKLLARLSATGPAFDNPLVICEAKAIRDRILRTMGMNPDGTFIKRP